MFVKAIAMLAAVLSCSTADTASAGVNIQDFPAGVIDSVGLTADDRGNMYVLSEFAYITKVTPEGHGTNLPFMLPVERDGPQYARNIVWGPDGALWFNCNFVTCHVDPNGAGLIDAPSYGYGSPGIQGGFWSADPVAHTVTRITPSGTTTVFQGLPPSCSTAAGRMTTGPDGAMWFICDTELISITGSGTITARSLPASEHYYNMVFGADGNVWVAADHDVVRFSPDGLELAAYPLGAQATSVALGPDGDVWFTYFGAGGIGRVSPSGHVSDFSDRIGPTNNPAMIVRAADGGMWVDDFFRAVVWRIDPDPPSALTEAAAGVGPDTATLNATVDPQGGPTTAYFEWGTTTNYGSRTETDDVGDGDSGVLTSAVLPGLASGMTYHYRVVAINGMRTVRGADRMLTTAPAATRTPSGVGDTRPPGETQTDADGDGYPTGVDCGDLDASVHPGAVDRPGDKIDQDCSGSAAPWGHLAPPVDARWSTHRARTMFTRFVVGSLPRRATITLGCGGGGCTFKTYRSTTRAAVAHTSLLTHMNRSRLRRGAQITLRLAAPGRATTIIRWRIGPPTRRTTTCLPPGRHRETACA